MKSIAQSLIASVMLPLSIASAESISMTIYNQNFGVVREQFELSLEQGVQAVDFTGMTRTLEPSSVVLRAANGASPFRILEQSYRADPINESSALAFFEGEVLDFERATGNEGETEIVRGRVIRSGHAGGEGPIIEQDGLLRFGLPGKPLFPRLDDDGILTPTLSWRIQSPEQQTLPVELSYLTQGLNWEADYNFVAPATGDDMQMMGWVTITNRSGRVYPQAQLKLLAGTVNRIRPERVMMRADVMAMDAAAPAVSAEAFDDFHLYTIAEPTTLRDQEQKQIEFLRAEAVKASRHYIVAATGYGSLRGEPLMQSGLRAATQRLPVQSFVRFDNSEANGLGVPLPAGRARFYRAASDGSLQFIGENRIGHTPRDETVELRLGEAFDWVAERTQASFDRNDGRRSMTETIRIDVRNRSDRDGRVEIMEALFRWSGWKIRSSTIEPESVDAQTVRFPLDVPARGEASVTYTVEYHW
jgi:hypothetical protein